MDAPPQIPPANGNPPPFAPSTPPSQNPAMPKGSDKLWSIASHLSAIIGLGLFVVPLIIYLVMKDESEYVAANAKEALNFHISIFLYCLLCVPLILFVVGIPLMIVIGIGSFILAIVAAVKAADGECYHYPLTLRLVH